MHWRHAKQHRNNHPQHQHPQHQPIRRHHHVRVPLHQLLIDQNPSQRNHQRPHHQQIAFHARMLIPRASRSMPPTQRNQRRPARRPRQCHPSRPIHPFMRPDRRPHRQNHRHRPHHQRRMAHRRQRKPIELNQKLQRHPQKRAGCQHSPLPPAELRLMRHQQRSQRQHPKQEPIEHHRPHVHLIQRNPPEEEPTPPQRTRRPASRKPQPPPLPLNQTHTLNSRTKPKAHPAQAAFSASAGRCHH